MRKFIVLAAFVLAACGGGGSSSNSTTPVVPASPTIDNLAVSPLAATVGSGSGGVGSGTVAFDFTSSADIVTLKINDSVDFGTQTFQVSGIAGLRSGHITAPIRYPTTTRQTVTFTFWVVDANGNSSNQLSGFIPIGG